MMTKFRHAGEAKTSEASSKLKNRTAASSSVLAEESFQHGRRTPELRASGSRRTEGGTRELSEVGSSPGKAEQRLLIKQRRMTERGLARPGGPTQSYREYDEEGRRRIASSQPVAATHRPQPHSTRQALTLTPRALPASPHSPKPYPPDAHPYP